MESMLEKKLVLQDEGSWAMMIEECNVQAIQKYHGAMAGLHIDYYLSLGKERYYMDYLDRDSISENQVRMIDFLQDDEKYSSCINEIQNILSQMSNAGNSYRNRSMAEKFNIYCELLREYIAYYNSVIADAFFERVYEIVDSKIPSELRFAQKVIKDSLFATDNTNLLSHMQTVDLINLANAFVSNRFSVNLVEAYVEKYRSTTVSSGNPNGASVDEIMQMLHEYKADEIAAQEALINNLHFRYRNAFAWSAATADMINLDDKTKIIVQRTSELSYIKILMREEFQKFKLYTRKEFLSELINEIGKSEFDYMRMDEIYDYICSKRRVPIEEINKRKEKVVFELIGNTISFSHLEPNNMVVETGSQGNALMGDVLIGSGCKKYKVKKVRQDEAGLIDFNAYINSENNKESIAIITNVLRPFLVPKLKDFGVLITQYGGYTSHASVLCRELGIYSLVNVDGVMSNLETDDQIEIDFDNGSIRKVDDLDVNGVNENVICFPLQSETMYPQSLVGSKAANIIKIGQRAATPRGFVLSTYALNNIDKLSVQNVIKSEIDSLKAPLIAIRSSHESEDCEHSSYAGLYESYVNVDSRDYELVMHLIKEVNRSGNSANLDEYARKRQGDMHVIIQEMIKADISGVMLTSEAHSGYEYIQNEYVVGDLCYLMQGEVTPAITYISKADIINGKHGFSAYPAVMNPEFIESFYELARISLELERVFGHRLEIEWGIRDKTIIIFQARFY